MLGFSAAHEQMHAKRSASVSSDFLMNVFSLCCWLILIVPFETQGRIQDGALLLDLRALETPTPLLEALAPLTQTFEAATA